MLWYLALSVHAGMNRVGKKKRTGFPAYGAGYASQRGNLLDVRVLVPFAEALGRENGNACARLVGRRVSETARDPNYAFGHFVSIAVLCVGARRGWMDV